MYLDLSSTPISYMDLVWFNEVSDQDYEWFTSFYLKVILMRDTKLYWWCHLIVIIVWSWCLSWCNVNNYCHHNHINHFWWPSQSVFGFSSPLWFAALLPSCWVASDRLRQLDLDLDRSSWEAVLNYWISRFFP